MDYKLKRAVPAVAVVADSGAPRPAPAVTDCTAAPLSRINLFLQSAAVMVVTGYLCPASQSAAATPPGMTCPHLSCVSSNKKKQVYKTTLDDYEYCKILYENARSRKKDSTTQQAKCVSKFENVQSLLQDMVAERKCFDNGGYHEDDYDYVGSFSKKIHSSKNSDYSFWSLDGAESFTSSESESSSYGPTQMYSDLIRNQSKYFYWPVY